MSEEREVTAPCALWSLAIAAPIALLWIPVGLKLRLPDGMELFFLFGGFVLPLLGLVLAAIALWRVRGDSRLALASLGVNGLLFVLHLLTIGAGFYTA
jgi:hypothetical protein